MTLERKGLDHVVCCVNDLDAAAVAFEKLGFTLTPRARHPFGTHNQLIQLDGFFIELLTIAEPEKLPEKDPSGFSFALFNKAFLSSREGISMIVADSRDFRKDHANAQQNQLKTFPPFEFSRSTLLPDGQSAKVSFGLNFVISDKMPMVGFFSCQQFNPEYFWFEDYQRHANGAKRIEEVGMVAEDLDDIGPFLGAFIGTNDVAKLPETTEIPTNRGKITVRTPSAFARRFNIAPPALRDGPLITNLVLGGPASSNSPTDKKQHQLFGMVVEI